MPLVHDYFDGYGSEKPHPKMTSTGSEGRCDICGRTTTRDHDEPWERVRPAYEEVPEPEPSFIGDPY